MYCVLWNKRDEKDVRLVVVFFFETLFCYNMEAIQVHRITLAVISFVDYKHLSSFLKHMHIDIV